MQQLMTDSLAAAVHSHAVGRIAALVWLVIIATCVVVSWFASCSPDPLDAYEDGP